MRVVTAAEIDRVLTYPALVEALGEAFRGDITVPVRHHHTIPQAGTDATLLLMPAWNTAGERFLGCKIVTVFPDNATRGRPSVHGTYLLLSGETGEPLAMMDGRTLTAWRTAAASALAARYLAREDAAPLGDGRRGRAGAAPGPRACAPCGRSQRVTLWNRTRARADVARLRRSSARRHRGRTRRRPRGSGARGRHHLLRHAFGDAAGQGAWLQAAPMSISSAVHAEDARGRRRGDAARRASTSTPATAR